VNLWCRLMPPSAAKRLRRGGGRLRARQCLHPIRRSPEQGGGDNGGWRAIRATHDFALARVYVADVAHLQNYNGTFQTDGYAVYDNFDHEGSSILGCWSHARRPFHQLATILKAEAPKSPVCRYAIGIVEAIGKLYARERTLRGRPSDTNRCVRDPWT
jgi:hypothetical protein